MQITHSFVKICLISISIASMSSCVDSGAGHGNQVGVSNSGQLLGKHPTKAQRRSDIKSELAGDFFIGRRYFVKKTTFWGYLRKPRLSWDSSRLVVMNEKLRFNPDRLPESGPGPNFGYDQNHEYRVWGHYTGEMIYEPNSNQFLPEFVPRRFELIDKDPGWLFSPNDRYDPDSITLRRN